VLEDSALNQALRPGRRGRNRSTDHHVVNWRQRRGDARPNAVAHGELQNGDRFPQPAPKTGRCLAGLQAHHLAYSIST